MRFLFLIAALMVPDMTRADNADYAAFLLEESLLENKLDNGVIHVNGREFLMGDLHEWPKASADIRVKFIVRSSVWLRQFLDSDPVLMYQDFEILRTRDSSFTGVRYLAHQMELAPDPPRDCAHCNFDLTLDPILQVNGYDTYAGQFGRLYFLPENSAIAHGFRCYLKADGAQTGELRFCSVTVVYPYATNIVLNGSRIHPGTVAEYGPGFAAIAGRMLEVITCIDITDRPGFKQPAASSRLLESHPGLTGCDIDLAG
ncbi:hypothetical protein [Roseobacter ponti]|uniref:Uncharacterized protein n=1 Tax=Roseobacter ponti TaxID=1891787 RepID=A0A858SMH4_9RHOB|nr:hypothetical protein [Roseobacter ponti]QJF50059.1 hypothetical protein G3256_02190 [Roseobacter ponti]